MSVDRSGQASFHGPCDFQELLRFTAAYDDRGGTEGFRAKSTVFHEMSAFGFEKPTEGVVFAFVFVLLIRCDQVERGSKFTGNGMIVFENRPVQHFGAWRSIDRVSGPLKKRFDALTFNQDQNSGLGAHLSGEQVDGAHESLGQILPLFLEGMR